MNKFARWGKRIATLLLLASFFMPLARCSVSTNQAVAVEAPTASQSKDTELTERDYFDVTGLDLISMKDWPLWLLTFTWPLIFHLLAATAPSLAHRKSVAWLEALLLTFSTYQMGYLIYHSDGIRYGSFFACSGIAAYAIVLVVQMRSATPNNSFKPSPLRGLGAGAQD